MHIQIKQVYAQADETDGRRILVDRLWPRGLSKEKAKVDIWAKGVAPSTELRRWYAHDPARWTEFKSRYAAELNAKPDQVRELLDEISSDTVTFVYGTKEARFNNAVALKLYVESLN